MPAATPQVINARKATYPFFLPVPTYTVPITLVVVASVYTTSVVIASVVTASVFTTPVFTTSASPRPPHHVYLHTLLLRLRFHLAHRM
jgi:hypothetical protein